MDFAVLFETFGSSGLFIGAIIYLFKRMEARDNARDREVKEREAQLSERINEGELYVRKTLVDQLKNTTTALEDAGTSMRSVSHALESIPCIVRNGMAHDHATPQPTTHAHNHGE